MSANYITPGLKSSPAQSARANPINWQTAQDVGEHRALTRL